MSLRVELLSTSNTSDNTLSVPTICQLDISLAGDSISREFLKLGIRVVLH